MALEPGQIIEGKYRIVRLLGEGGMGAVYEGENTAIQRKVAIKILHAAVADNKDAVSRFEKEAQAAGRIGSDHITEVLDLGTLTGGDRFMVMEYLDGMTLSKRITDRTRLTPAEAAPILAQLLEGLGSAHDAGIIHRDLKPDNVYLLKSKAGRKDFVKILDFGISKFNQLSGDSAMSMTRTGAVMGTPYYMSPEQAKGAKEIDARSDLYSIGVIMYEAITGQVPFNADTFNELIFKIVLEVPPPPEQFAPDLDPAFAAIIRKAMAREPAQRFQNAPEFQAAVMQWMQSGNVPLFEDSGTTVGRPPMQSYGNIAAGSSPATMATHNAATPQNWGGTTGGGHAATSPPDKKSSAGLFAVIGIAAVVILGGGIFTLTKVMGAKEHTDAAATPPPPPVTASATATATAAETTTASATASAPPVAPVPADTTTASATPPVASAKVPLVVGGHGNTTPGQKPPQPPPTGGRHIRTDL
jgi:serine/threonine-protein kinase